MSYVAQLLPDLEEARILRSALALYIANENTEEDQRDIAWSLLAKLTKDMRTRK